MLYELAPQITVGYENGFESVSGNGTISGLSYHDDFAFAVEVADPYLVGEVTVNDAPLEPDSIEEGVWYGTISASVLQTDNAVLKVTAREAENTVTFSHGEGYRIKIGEDNNYSETLSGDYTVSGLTYDSPYRFMIEVDEGYTLDSVQAGEQEIEPVSDIYTISANIMNTNPTVTVNCAAITHTVNFDRIDDKGNAVDAIVYYGDNYAVSANKVDGVYQIADIGYGQALTFKTTAPAGYLISKVELKNSDSANIALKANKQGVYSLTKEQVAANPTVIITCEIKKSKITFVNATKAKITYWYTDAEVSADSVKDKFTVSNATNGFKFKVEPQGNSNLVDVKLGNEELKANADGIYVIDALADNATVTVNCKKYATGIKYGGKTYSGDNNDISIQQTANTTKTYKMTVLGVDKNFNPEEDLAIGFNSTVGKSCYATIKTTAYNAFELEITTPYHYVDDETSDMFIAILSKDAPPDETQTIATVWVNNTLPILKAPTVKVSEVSDISAKLTLTDKAKLSVSDGDVYFQICANDADGNPVALAIFDADGTMLYVPAKDYEGSQTVYFREFGYENPLAAQDYTVTVRTCIGREANGKMEYVFSDDATNPKTTQAKVSLRYSAFEANLELKKVASKIYTGQEEVVLAAPVFSKTTTPAYRSVADAWITTPQGDLVNYGVELGLDQEGNFCADFGKDLEPGTYVLHAIPVYPMTSYTKEATLTFKVLQGIEKIEFSEADVNVFRADKKKVTYTLPSIIYNEGKTVPANKAVTYSIAPASGNQDTAGNKGYVTINEKTGKVTIDRKYVLSSNEANAKFEVTATAADFSRGNNPFDDITATMTFTIKNTVNEIPYLTLCEYQEGKLVKVTPRDGKYMIDNAGGDTKYAIIATNNEIPEDGLLFTSTDIIHSGMYTLKCDNKNVVIEKRKYKKESVCYAKADVKNAKFTATTNDGGKKSKEIKGVTFRQLPYDLSYQVLSVNDENGVMNLSISDNEAVNESVELYDSGDMCIVAVNASFGGEPVAIEKTNTTYSVKVDKGLEIRDYYREFDRDIEDDEQKKGIAVRFTGKSSVKGADGEKYATGKITFTYDVIGGGTRTETLTITNNKPYGITAGPSSIKQIRTLYADDNNEDRWIDFTVKDSKSYAASGKKAVITPLLSEMNKKNTAFSETYYSMLETICGEDYTVTDDGKLMIEFSPGKSIAPYTPGTYQFGVVFGTRNADTNFNFVAETKITKLSIKVSKAQSITPVTSYTMSDVSPVVTLTAKKVTPDTTYSFDNIKNANVKGVENEFTKYFEFDYASQSIYLTDVVIGDTAAETQANIEALAKNTKDLQGYVTYKIDDTNTFKTVLIKIKIETKKNADKKFTTALIQDEWYNSYDYMPISIQFNKAEVDIKHAYTDAEQMTVTVDNKRVNIKGISKEKTYTLKNVNIYVVKEGSIYESFLTDLKTAADAEATSVEKKAAYEEAMKKYGSKVILKKVTFLNIT